MVASFVHKEVESCERELEGMGERKLEKLLLINQIT